MTHPEPLEQQVLPMANSVADSWITDMLKSASPQAKARVLLDSGSEEQLNNLRKLDLQRPNGLGLGAELTHGRLLTVMSHADTALKKGIRKDAIKARNETIQRLHNQAKVEEAAEEKEHQPLPSVKPKVKTTRQKEILAPIVRLNRGMFNLLSQAVPKRTLEGKSKVSKKKKRKKNPVTNEADDTMTETKSELSSTPV